MIQHTIYVIFVFLILNYTHPCNKQSSNQKIKWIKVNLKAPFVLIPYHIIYSKIKIS